MPTRVACPVCVTRLLVSDTFPQGPIRCPKCKTTISLSSISGEVASKTICKLDSPDPSSNSPSFHRCREPHHAASRPLPSPDASYSFQNAQQHPTLVTSNLHGTLTLSNSFGIASLVVGVVSLFFCCVPGVGMILSGLGLILGLAGVIFSFTHRGSGAGFAIAGTVMSGLPFSLHLCIGAAALTSSFLTTTLPTGDTPEPDTSQLLPNMVMDGTPQDPDGENREAAAKNDPKPNKLALPQMPDWVDASTTAIDHRELQIRVTQVRVGQVPLQTFNGVTSSSEDFLMIFISIENKGRTTKVEYRPWHAELLVLDRHSASLKDNFGNTYRPVTFGFGTQVVGAVDRSASIFPRATVTDTLVFQKPIDAMEHLYLELPATNFGGVGLIRFRIPRSMVRGIDPLADLPLPKDQAEPARDGALRKPDPVSAPGDLQPQEIKNDASRSKVNDESRPNKDAADPALPRDPAATADDSPIEPGWIDARRNPIRLGPIQVRVVRTTIGRVAFQTLKEIRSTKEVYLMVRLEISNLAPFQTTDYRSWSSHANVFEREFAILEDEAGNKLKHIQFSEDRKVHGTSPSLIRLSPGRTVHDLLVFEPPAEKVKYLKLELLGRNLGVNEPLRFQIPKSMIQRQR